MLVWPVRVQGETSAAEVAAAIAGFNALPEGGRIPRPDVIIVARGGGSLEDLMGFNEENVVRAAAASLIPLVSAVGHETDWTLIDHAADLRCPTPTGAAEKVVPVRAELMAMVADLSRRQSGAMRRLSDRRRSDLRALARALPGPEAVLSGPRQRLDLSAARLAPALARNARVHEQQAQALAQRLARQSPSVRLAGYAARLDGLSSRLRAGRDALLRAETLRVKRADERVSELNLRAGRALAALLLRRQERIEALAERGTRCFSQGLVRRRDRLASLGALVASLGPQSVLARGYALVRDESGALVRSVTQVQAGQRLSIQLGDGAVAAVAGGEGAARTPRPARKEPAKPGQGDLF